MKVFVTVQSKGCLKCLGSVTTQPVSSEWQILTHHSQAKLRVSPAASHTLELGEFVYLEKCPRSAANP